MPPAAQPLRFKRAAALKDVSPGQGLSVKVNGKMIALFNVDGKFYAIDDACIHRGAPLGDGPLRDSVVTCPWHGWEFDVVRGCSTVSPEVKVTAYRTEIRGEHVYVATEPFQKATDI